MLVSRLMARQLSSRLVLVVGRVGQMRMVVAVGGSFAPANQRWHTDLVGATVRPEPRSPISTQRQNQQLPKGLKLLHAPVVLVKAWKLLP